MYLKFCFCANKMVHKLLLTINDIFQSACDIVIFIPSFYSMVPYIVFFHDTDCKNIYVVY